jgi:hypothetical protein
MKGIYSILVSLFCSHIQTQIVQKLKMRGLFNSSLEGKKIFRVGGYI